MFSTNRDELPDPVSCPMCGDGSIHFQRRQAFPYVGQIGFRCHDCPYHGVLPTDDDSPVGTSFREAIDPRRTHAILAVAELLRP